jgi:hypothetical protein
MKKDGRKNYREAVSYIFAIAVYAFGAKLRLKELTKKSDETN